MTNDETKRMLLEYMDRGYLDNIIALFRTDGSLYQFIPDLLKDERMKVRLGAAALIEELMNSHAGEIRSILPHLIGLLTHENPNVRGDTAYVLGVIKDPGARDALRQALADANSAVKETAQEALDQISAAISLKGQTGK